MLSPRLLSPVEISSRKERKRPIYPVPHCSLCIKFCPEAFRKSSVSEISPLKERKGLIYPVPYCILCIKLCPPHSKSSLKVGYLNESNFYHFFIGLFFRFFSSFTLNPKYSLILPCFCHHSHPHLTPVTISYSTFKLKEI